MAVVHLNSCYVKMADNQLAAILKMAASTSIVSLVREAGEKAKHYFRQGKFIDK